MHHDQTKSLPSKSFCFIFHICILVPPRTCIIINKNLTVLKGSLQEIHLFNCWKIATSRLNKFEAFSFNDKKSYRHFKTKTKLLKLKADVILSIGSTLGSPSAARLMYFLQASFENIFTVKNVVIQELCSFCHF